MVAGQRTWLDHGAVGVDNTGTVVVVDRAKAKSWFGVNIPSTRAHRITDGFAIIVPRYSKLRRIPAWTKAIDVPVVDVRQRGRFGLGSKPLQTLAE
jgi:hypothetical protein